MTDRRFNVTAAAGSGNRYSLEELDSMADQLLATAAEFDAPRLGERVHEPNHDRMWAAYVGRKPRGLL